MGDDHFRLNVQGRVAHLQLHRAERGNTLAPAFFTALRDALRGLHEGGVVRALVVSAEGTRFSAGMPAGAAAAAVAPPSDRRDPNASAAREAVGAILDMLDERGTPGREAPPVRPLDALHALADVPFPVICAVQGHCDGAALALACACDLRLASADAAFGLHDPAHPSAADPVVLHALGRLLPHGTVRLLAYTGERLGAEQARTLGFVEAVLPDAAGLLHHALALAARIAARPPLAVAAAKDALRQGDAAGWLALRPAATRRPA